MLNTNTQKNRGDTIVEALIALAIAAFAVGIAYATANRSLDQAITARERNQALNIIQNQITDLRIRYTNDSADDFKNNVAAKNHFCLDDNAVLYPNTTPPPVETTLQGGGHPYDDKCWSNITGDGATYYIDITTMPTTPAPSTYEPGVNYTVFQVAVRWDRAGGGAINQASLFFRPDGRAN